MDANSIILGILEGNKEAIDEFKGFYKKVLLSNPNFEFSTEEIEDIFQSLIEYILLDNRNIVSIAKENKITKSYLKRWILWNAKDELIKLYKLYKGNEKKDEEENNEEDINKSKLKRREVLIKDAAYSVYLETEKDGEIEDIYIHNYIKDLSISPKIPSDLVEQELDRQRALSFCNELMQFLRAQKDKEIIVFCSYLKYLDKPKDISQANYNQIFRRLKVKIRNFFKDKVEYLKDVFKEGYLKECDFEKFCLEYKGD